jgi:hypothetical protein
LKLEDFKKRLPKKITIRIDLLRAWALIKRLWRKW